MHDDSAVAFEVTRRPRGARQRWPRYASLPGLTTGAGEVATLSDTGMATEPNESSPKKLHGTVPGILLGPPNRCSSDGFPVRDPDARRQTVSPGRTCVFRRSDLYVLAFPGAKITCGHRRDRVPHLRSCLLLTFRVRWPRGWTESGCVHWSEAARLINEAGQTKSNALAFSDRRQQPRPDGAESGTGHAHGAPRRWSNPMSESTARG